MKGAAGRETPRAEEKDENREQDAAERKRRKLRSKPATFVAAVFDAAALPQLLSVLAAGLPPAADPASAAIGEQRLMAALRLLQNLSGRYGQVRAPVCLPLPLPLPLCP